MLDIISKILLLGVIILQLILVIFILYTSCKRYQEDKKFWKKQDEISEEFLKQAKAQTEMLNEGVAMREPENTSEE